MEDVKSAKVHKAVLLGWKYNSGNKHSPKWVHPRDMPEGYSRGGQITLTSVGYPGEKMRWALPSRFQQGAGVPYHAHFHESQVTVLVEIDGRLWSCQHMGDLKPLEFTAGATMRGIKGDDTTVDPQAFVLNLKSLIDHHREISNLYQEMYASIAREYGEW